MRSTPRAAAETEKGRLAGAVARGARRTRRLFGVFALIATISSVLVGGYTAYADKEYMLSVGAGQTQTAQINTAFSTQLSVTVCVNGTFPCIFASGVSVTFTAPASGASGGFAGSGTTATVVSDSNGVATAPVFTANGTAGSYTVQAVETEPDCGPPPAGSTNPQWCASIATFSLTNSTTSVTRPTLISQGDGSSQSAVVGSQYAGALSAIVFIDSTTSPPIFASGVTVTFHAPDTGASVIFSDTGTNTDSVVTDSTGVANSGTFKANLTAGQFFVDATVSGSQTQSGQPLTTNFSLTNSLTNVTGVPVIVSVAAGEAQNAGTMSPFPTNMAVTVLDGNLNYVAGATVVFTAPASGPSGTFTGGTSSTTYVTTTGPTGLATAGTFTANAQTGQYTVNVSAAKNGVAVTTGIVLSNGRVKTTTTLTAVPSSSSVYGQPIALTATVTPQTGTLVITAPVTFKMAGTAIPTCTSLATSGATGGVAICVLNPSTATSFLAAGSYSFTADYLGDTVSQPSTTATPLSYTINPAGSNTTLTTDHPTFVKQGDAVTFTATLSAVSPGRGTPTGTVTFTSDDGTVLNGGAGVALVNGSAQVTTSALQPGAPHITASYAGDANFHGSNQQLTQNVYSLPVVAINPNSQAILVNTAVTFTAAASGVPSPTVQWQVSPPGGNSFTDIASATGTTYTFTTARAQDQNQYRAVFTNAIGSATSQAATLTVEVPTITLSNLSATSITSNSATLNASVAASFATVSRKGFEYVAGTFGTPFDPNNLPVGTTAVQAGPGAGPYSVGIGNITPLTPGTTYSYVAFARDDTIGLEAWSEVETFTTPRASTSLTVAAASGPYGGATTLSATLTTGGAGLGGKTIAFTLNGLGVGTATTDGNGQASMSGVSLAGLSVGTFANAAGASFAGDSGYLDSTGTNTLVVNLANQATLTANGPTSATYGQALTPSATGGSGTGSISFTASGTACAMGTVTTSGMLVITAGSGACALTATKAGDANYAPATSAPLTVAVNPAPLTVTASSPSSIVFGSAAPTVSPLYNGFVGNDGPNSLATPPTCGTPYTSSADVGTYPTTCSGAVSSNYAFTYMAGSFQVTQAQGSVAINNLPASPTVTQTFTPQYAALGNGTASTTSMSTSICSVGTSGLVTFLDVGTCQLQASITASTDYLAATGALQTVTVGLASTSLTLPSDSGTYGGTVTLTASLSVGTMPVGGKTISFTLNGTSMGTATTGTSGVATLPNVSLAGISSGAYPSSVGASFGGDRAYLGSTGTGSLTVNKAPGSVTISNLPTSAAVGNSFTPTYTLLGDGTPSTASQSPSICTATGGIVSFVAQGTCTLQASVTQGTNYLAATGSAQSVTVGAASKKASSTTLSSSLNPSLVGQSVTFTASVSPASSTGPVTFQDGGTVLGTSQLGGMGSATLTSTTLSAGSHSITAVYGGSSTTSGSTSTALVQVVNPGTTFTLSVTIAGNGTATSQPTGINCTPTCSASFAAGTSVTLSAQPATGSVFTGWSGDCTGTGTCAVSMTAARAVTARFGITTTTTLTSSANPATFGQSVTFTATVSPTAASGTVTFLDGGTTLGTGTLSGGVARYATSSLSAGSHTITAAYGGNTSYAPSTDRLPIQVVRKLATTTMLTSSANPSVVGQSVTFTATVSPSAATGTVMFLDGTTVLGTRTLAGGIAAFTTSSLSSGTHSITVVYSGDATYGGSTSAALSQVVSKK